MIGGEILHRDFTGNMGGGRFNEAHGYLGQEELGQGGAMTSGNFMQPHARFN